MARKKILPVNGILQLTNMRLRFLSNYGDYFSYLLTDIVSVTFNNYLAIFPIGFAVEFSDGRKELFFYAMKSEGWINSILIAQAQAGVAADTEKTSDGTILDLECVAIRQRISRHFNYDEIKTICFDLDVDYDNLPGSNKDEKARELVVFLDRSGKLENLLKRAQELRPNIVWY